MKPPDGDRISRAIDAAEHGTTGRIAVRIVSTRAQDALEEARRHFAQANLQEHEHRNAVIFFVAPKARRFAVFGDEEMHARVGEGFWNTLVDEMQPYFAKGEMTEGLVLGIARVGEQFRAHFTLHAQVPE